MKFRPKCRCPYAQRVESEAKAREAIARSFTIPGKQPTEPLAWSDPQAILAYYERTCAQGAEDGEGSSMLVELRMPPKADDARSVSMPRGMENLFDGDAVSHPRKDLTQVLLERSRESEHLSAALHAQRVMLAFAPLVLAGPAEGAWVYDSLLGPNHSQRCHSCSGGYMRLLCAAW